MSEKIESFWPKKLGWILIPPVTQLFKSTEFFLSVHWEKNWVILTYKVGSNFVSASDSTFKVKMTHFFLSVHWEQIWVILTKKVESLRWDKNI